MPSWAKVTEILLQDKKQLQETEKEESEFRAKGGSRRGARSEDRQQGVKRKLICFYCGKPGHMKKECKEFLESRGKGRGKPKKALVASGSALTCKSRDK